MDGNERSQLRRAYEVAKAVERAYREHYFPVKALGSRAPDTVTAEVSAELERLAAVSEAARAAWEGSSRSQAAQ